jgi:Flp pilus assembly pilin Flp
MHASATTQHSPRADLADETGQATAEYGLVLVAAAGIAAALMAFANANIGKLFTSVLSKILRAAS